MHGRSMPANSLIHVVSGTKKKNRAKTKKHFILALLFLRQFCAINLESRNSNALTADEFFGCENLSEQRTKCFEFSSLSERKHFSKEIWSQILNNTKEWAIILKGFSEFRKISLKYAENTRTRALLIIALKEESMIL